MNGRSRNNTSGIEPSSASIVMWLEPSSIGARRNWKSANRLWRDGRRRFQRIARVYVASSIAEPGNHV